MIVSKEILNLSVTETVAGVRDGKVSPTQIASAYFEQIEKHDGKVGAFLSLLKEKAMDQAAKLEKKRKEGGNLGRLAGVTVALKDNMALDGFPLTCASKILKGHTASYTATTLEKLEAEGAVFVGKTNLDEFAMGSSTENSAFHVTKNPWNLNCVPGGSSGGSAAAVAASMALTSLGSDTGGSIRQPAALCGSVGLKPTYGAVSRYGLVAFASSLDQIGPMARTAEDAQAIFEVLSGHDPKDSTSLSKPLPRAQDFKGKKIRLGLPKEYFQGAALDGAVDKSMKEAVEVFKKEGFEIKEVSLPNTQYALPVYYILAPSEASANLARYDGVRYGARAAAKDLIELYQKSRTEGFGPEVQRRILIGTFALSHGYYEAYYGKANQARAAISEDFKKAFDSVDYLITPTAPTPAFKIGEKAQDPVSMYLSDIFTIPVNLAGVPAISIPCGFSQDKLPIGLQIIGPMESDFSLLSLAAFFERATGKAFVQRPNL